MCHSLVLTTLFILSGIRGHAKHVPFLGELYKIDCANAGKKTKFLQNILGSSVQRRPNTKYRPRKNILCNIWTFVVFWCFKKLGFQPRLIHGRR